MILIVFASLIVASLASPLPPAMPRCLPDQFEGFLNATTSYSVPGTSIHGIVKINESIHFDKTNNRVAVNSSVSNDGKDVMTSRVLFLHQDGEQIAYIIMSDKCIKAKVDRNLQDTTCIPDNFQHYTNYHMGLHGGYNVSGFTGTVNGMEQDITVMKHGDNIIPLTIEMAGVSNGVNIATNMKVFNVTIGIKDVRIFDVPEICQKVMEITNIKLDPSLKMSPFAF